MYGEPISNKVAVTNDTVALVIFSETFIISYNSKGFFDLLIIITVKHKCYSKRVIGLVWLIFA